MKRFKCLMLLGILSLSVTYANVKVLAGDCSGAVFTMPGMTEEQQALVLTNGHCIGQGSFMGRYPDHGEFFINHEHHHRVILKKDKRERGRRFSYRNILFATMTSLDIAIIELDASYKQLRKEGYAIYSVADEDVRPGMVIEFDSYNRLVHSVCEVDGIVPSLREGPWTWNNSIRMKAGRQCRYVHGQSGTAGIEQSSSLIYGLAQTMYEGGKPCSFNNPCEVHYENDTSTISTGVAHQPYAVSTRFLYACYDEDIAEFDFQSCVDQLPSLTAAIPALGSGL